MPTRRHVLFAAGLLVSGLATGAAVAEEPAAAAHLEAIYKKITAGKGDSGGQIFWSEPKDRAKWFSAGLNALWAKAEKRLKAQGEEMGPIDFDPFTNSQDPQVKGFAIEKLDAVAPITKLRVRLKGPGYQGEDGVLVFDLVQEKGWKIDDIHGSTGGDRWSIREILSMP